jgi:hypothetical protein
MNVSSAVEIYTLVLGWLLYDGLWDLLSASGLLYVPLVGAVWKNWASGIRASGDESSGAVVRTSWMDVFAIMSVIALAGTPIFPVKMGDLSHVTPCGGTEVPGGATGTLYDSAFAAINGRTAKIPLWWYGLLSVANGINSATVALIPCSPDLRTLTYVTDNTSISDPELRKELQSFSTDCWAKARAKLLANHVILPKTYRSDDTDWLGSSYFLNTDGYYGNSNINLALRASAEITNFPYVSTRDTEYDTSVFTPPWGRPECKDWWQNDPNGLRVRLVSLLDSDALAQANTELGDLDQAKDRLIQRLLMPESAVLGDALAITNYNDLFSGDHPAISGSKPTAAVTALGLGVEMATWTPKIYALRQAAPIGQALILMGVYLFLPFVLVMSAYSIEVLFTVTVAVFGIKFLTPIWTLAVWIDNHLVEGLGIKWYDWLSTNNDKGATLMILNLMAMFVFVILPIIWFAVIGWAGVNVSRAMDTLTNAHQPIKEGASRSTTLVTSAANSMLKK